MPTLQTPEQENQRNIRSPSETGKSGSVCVPTDKTNSTILIKIEDYKQWVSDHLLKAADLYLRPKVVSLLEDANELLKKVKIELSVQEENVCEEITSDASYPVSKITDEIPQENQREKGITNQVGNLCDELYRGILQNWLPWDQTDVGQRRS